MLVFVDSVYVVLELWIEGAPRQNDQIHIELAGSKNSALDELSGIVIVKSVDKKSYGYPVHIFLWW